MDANSLGSFFFFRKRDREMMEVTVEFGVCLVCLEITRCVVIFDCLEIVSLRKVQL